MCLVRELDLDNYYVVGDEFQRVRLVDWLEECGHQRDKLEDYAGFLVDDDGEMTWSVYGFGGLGPFLDREAVKIV